MKYRIILFLLTFSLFSCENPTEEDQVAATPVIKKRTDFGFDLNQFNVVNDTVDSGDTFGGIIGKQNLGQLKVHDLISIVRDSFDVRQLRRGKPFTMLRSLDRKKELQVFIYQPDQVNYLVIDLRDSVQVYKKTRPVTIRKRTIAGELDGSLSEALQKEKVDPALAAQIAKVYQWTIDFFKLQKGDKFGVTFTERFINDTIYDGIDTLHAAFFEYKGKNIYAFAFAQNPESGKVEYYDHEGKPLKNFFLKAPLKFSRISSRFSKRRFHPVQSVWKAHKGTDYAAPTGTPIMTTAAGVVERTGYTAGNGNYVKVKHNNTYSTQYLHMSKILVRRGQRVNQGDIIGRVGSTGLATGPHVCYRFWKNGVQVDALALKLPNADPMSNKHKPRFLAQIEPFKRELDSVAGIRLKK
ncbi:MAG: peptidoglycan DD-metalloendopeptidase family protein [Flavobacterium sp.]|nr:peptidoglycan DD-metalloendopeptidase family protein [Flavobacterium sp.]